MRKLKRTTGTLNLSVLLMTVALSTVMLPAEAHTKVISGSVMMQSGDNFSTTQWGSLDFVQYENSSCADIKDGKQAAVINVTTWRNHRATLKVTTHGDATATYVIPGIGTAACGDQSKAYSEPLVRPGYANSKTTRKFLMPSNATYLLLEHLGNQFGTLTVNYELTLADV